MSVTNFDGDGYGDTSGLVYGYENSDTGDTEIHKVVRSGFGELSPSPGDVIPMGTTRSTGVIRCKGERQTPGKYFSHRNINASVMDRTGDVDTIELDKPSESDQLLKLDTRGRITIPSSIRHRHNIDPGDDNEYWFDLEIKKIEVRKPIDDDEGGDV